MADAQKECAAFSILSSALLRICLRLSIAGRYSSSPQWFWQSIDLSVVHTMRSFVGPPNHFASLFLDMVFFVTLSLYQETPCQSDLPPLFQHLRPGKIDLLV